MDEKLKKIIIMVLGVFIIIFLVLFLITSCGSKLSPQKLEEHIVTKTKNYYKNHKEELPSEGAITNISLSDLVNKGIVKDLEKSLEKNTTCSGMVTIENNNNYYMYSPLITCSSENETYSSTNLFETLLTKIVSTGNGLYAMYDSYYFKGDSVDNYIIFDGLLWRITKINNDHSIRLIEAGKRRAIVWDDRYNEDMKSSSGINDYMNFNNNANSRIKDSLDQIYSDNSVFTDEGKGYIKKTNLCIGKRGINDIGIDGSIECSSILENQYLGLLQLNEYMIASLDDSCISALSHACLNYNYLADFQNAYWTLTANSEKSNQAFKIYNTVNSTTVSGSGLARLVINISDATNVSGTGTEDDPYIVSGFSSELRELD